ncbi:MAG: alpha-2-macroglobulin family protein [Candidatus Omnitrophica bacterium]|nr:alpha-2-macroglobulin family protein [Candidatus Omnitrophota bacterium]
MPPAFKKKWAWVVILFLIINIAGLLKIISLYEQETSVIAFIETKFRQIMWPAKKAMKDISKRFEAKEEFTVRYITPNMDIENPEICIIFTQKVDLDKIKGYISVTPEVEFHAESYYNGLKLFGDFKPGTSYAIEVLKGMPFIKGAILQETVVETAVMPDYQPELKFKVPGMYMSLKGSQTVPVEVVNLDKIKVKVHKVYGNNIVYLLNNMSAYRIPSDVGLDLFEKEIETKIERNKPKDVLISLKDILGDDSRGLFYMTVSNPEEYYMGWDSKLILTTNIGIVAKRSESDLLVWLNTISGTKAVPYTEVKVFTKTNQQILQGATDESGLIHFKDVDWSGDKAPFVITASNDYDLSYIELEKCAISETAFDIQGRPYLSSGYEAMLYTDRGVYRPGETAHLKAILRNETCDVPGSFPVVFEIKRPDGREFKRLNGILSEFGTADIDVAIEDYSLTGAYTANLLLPGDKKIIGNCKFSVEEFMPDRLKVSIDVPDKRFGIKDAIPINVQAEQFFGAAASGRDIEVTCRLKHADFKPKGYEDYSFTDKSKEFSARTLRLGEKKSDNEGMASFELKVTEDIAPPSVLECSISAVVKELGGRAITSNASRLMDAYPYYIGIRKKAEGYASVGEEVRFDYVAVSPDGESVKIPDLEVSVYKIIWSSVLKKDTNGRYRYVSEDREEVVFEDTISREKASGTYVYTPKSYGSYAIRVKSKGKIAHTAGIEFYCSGYGCMPWSMERPDRIELVLDKSLYKPGDVAKLLIKSPFQGKALVTVSKDKVLLSKSIDLSGATQEIPITIDKDFWPNAYCAVTVIKPVTASEEWVSHRAYGIVPVMLDNSANKLKVSISVPEKARPEDTVKVDIDVKDAKGSPRQAELSVALVDEGLLQLTGYKTPDPFEFFRGKRANAITTSDLYSLLLPEFDKKKVGADSTPSADMPVRGFDPRKHLTPISAKRVKPVVLWQGSRLTDRKGRVTVDFKIPEFSGRLRVMVVACGMRDFGNTEDSIKITEPLMIQPTIPRFLSVEDEFILPVSVFNTTGKDGTAGVSVKVSEGIGIIGEGSRKIYVKNNEEAVVVFKLKAPSTPQKAKITLTASLGDHQTSRTTEVPVRPPAPYTSISGSGSVKAPGKASIAMPADWLKGTQKYKLSVMPLPGIAFAGGLRFLARYPYGCIEQTTSCVYPLLYLKEVAAATDPAKFNSSEADSYIDEGIRRVLSMQLYTGGFSMWPGYSEPSTWNSVYATDFLVEADKAGYAVLKTEKAAALGYIESLLSESEDDCPLSLKAYSCFVLAKAGRVKPSWIRRLQERKDDLPAYSRFHLAAALAALGDKKAVSDILGQGFPDKDVKRETGDSLNSYTRENAIALSVYMDIDPENAMVPVLIKRLEASMKNGSWGTTQDNAQALLALGKYTRYADEHASDYSGSLSIGKELAAEFDSEAPLDMKDIDLGGGDIALNIRGTGTAYYYWCAEGVPASGKVKEEDKGLRVRRKFFTRDGSSVDINNIRQGEIIVVDISLKADIAYKNLIVADLLPACFEIENPRIATRERVGWISKDVFEPDHIDIRDDRLLMFTDLPKTDTQHYRYIVRAVTKGKFRLPPVSAECMYDPSIKSVHGQGEVEVKAE